MPQPTLKPQEVPFDNPDSINMFEPGPDKPFVATPGAIEMYSHETIVACLRTLNALAKVKGGIDYLQIFNDDTKSSALWIIEDGVGGAITALLPEEY